jgi:hypothetical protein
MLPPPGKTGDHRQFHSKSTAFRRRETGVFACLHVRAANDMGDEKVFACQDNH